MCNNFHLDKTGCKKPRSTTRDIRQALSSLLKAGLVPTALDLKPDGTYRWHLDKLTKQEFECDLDRELEEFEASENGHN